MGSSTQRADEAVPAPQRRQRGFVPPGHEEASGDRPTANKGDSDERGIGGGNLAFRVRRSHTKMICVTIEIREGPLTRRMQITAPSIERAMKVAEDGKPGHRVRLLFPIEPEAFFVPDENSDQREAA